MKLTKEQIVPGQVLKVKAGKDLHLDAPYMLSGSHLMAEGGQLVVVTKPRKRDGINLVRVKVNSDDEYECFYTDIVYKCELG